MSIQALFRGQQEARNAKPTGGSANRVTVPQGEGYVDVRLVNPPVEKRSNDMPFVVSYHYFATGTVLTSVNKKDPVTGYLTGPDPLQAASRKYWAKYQRAKALGDDAAKDAAYKVAKALTPTPRYTWLAVEVDKPSEGVKLLTVSEATHNLMVDLIAGNPKLGDDGAGDVFDFATGRTLRLIKSKGNGSFMVFDKSKFLVKSNFGSPGQHQQWLDTCPDLNSLNPSSTLAELNEHLAEILGTPVHTEDADPTSLPEDDDFLSKIRQGLQD